MGLAMRMQPNASLGTSSSMFLCTGNSGCKVTDETWTLLTGDKDSRQPSLLKGLGSTRQYWVY